MKIYILIAAILISPITVAKPIQPVSDKEHESNCRFLMEAAYQIMENKQEGMSLREMLTRNDQANDLHPSDFLYESTQLIIRDAFSQPETSDTKKQLNDFSAKYYLGCMEMYKSLY